MKKDLNGLELVGFIKERQAKAVRGLRQQFKIVPKLAIIRTNPDAIVDSYMRIKQNYGQDILIEVEVHTISQDVVLATIEKLNNDEGVHGIIVQIPLPDKSQTNEILNSVKSQKDVDGLAEKSKFEAPTAVAINWLLAGYGVELVAKKCCNGREWSLSREAFGKIMALVSIEVKVADRKIADLKSMTKEADILVTATGSPSLVTADMVKPTAIIVDAGVSTDSNGLVGDVAQDVRDLPDVTITPVKGGVGPLTVSALYENVITAARNSK